MYINRVNLYKQKEREGSTREVEDMAFHYLQRPKLRLSLHHYGKLAVRSVGSSILRK